MDRLSLGNRVISVRGLFVGSVSDLRGCCFEVTLPGDLVNLRADAIFTVDDDRVSLICEADGLPRYLCTAVRHDDNVAANAGF